MAAFILRAPHWVIFLFFVLSFLAPTTVVTELCYWGWFWILGSFLNSVTHPELKPRRLFFLVSLAYVGLVGAFFDVIYMADLDTVTLLLLLSAPFVQLYILYFLAKSLALVEMARPVTFRDFLGRFFLFWFYPIGVWILQPRINQIYAAVTAEAQAEAASAEATPAN